MYSTSEPTHITNLLAGIEMAYVACVVMQGKGFLPHEEVWPPREEFILLLRAEVTHVRWTWYFPKRQLRAVSQSQGQPNWKCWNALSLYRRN